MDLAAFYKEVFRVDHRSTAFEKSLKRKTRNSSTILEEDCLELLDETPSRVI